MLEHYSHIRIDAKRQAPAAVEDFAVLNEDRSATDVAKEMLRRARWLQPRMIGRSPEPEETLPDRRLSQ
jgi:hypothetical protein